MKRIASLFGGVALLAFTPLVHADTQIAYNIGGGAVVCANDVPGTPTPAPPGEGSSCFPAPGTIVAPGVFFENISTTGQQGAPLPGESQQQGSALTVENTSGSTVTIELWFSANGFTAPVTPPSINYTSNLELTETGIGSTTSMVSCVATGNGLVSSAANFCLPAGSPTLTNNNQILSGNSTPPEDTVSTLITSLSAPFSLEEELTIVLKSGTTLGITTGQVLVPVPEPGALLLLGSLLVMVGRKKLRRRTA